MPSANVMSVIPLAGATQLARAAAAAVVVQLMANS